MSIVHLWILNPPENLFHISEWSMRGVLQHSGLTREGNALPTNSCFSSKRRVHCPVACHRVQSLSRSLKLGKKMRAPSGTTLQISSSTVPNASLPMHIAFQSPSITTWNLTSKSQLTIVSLSQRILMRLLCCYSIPEKHIHQHSWSWHWEAHFLALVTMWQPKPVIANTSKNIIFGSTSKNIESAMTISNQQTPRQMKSKCKGLEFTSVASLILYAPPNTSR